jgi:hypothetical protein
MKQKRTGFSPGKRGDFGLTGGGSKRDGSNKVGDSIQLTDAKFNGGTTPGLTGMLSFRRESCTGSE